MSQKSAEELYLITLKDDAKFEKELTCPLKDGMKNLTNFDPSIKSLKICTLCVMTLKGYAIFKKKLTGGLKNDIKNLVNFHASSHKSENLHFNGFVLSKAYKFLDEKVQKCYVS